MMNLKIQKKMTEREKIMILYIYNNADWAAVVTFFLK